MALRQAVVAKCGSRLPMELPRIIQFPVNDICNSRCVMCDIWKRKRDHEISPAELRAVLSDRLFQQVTYVGISGGEPTLRRDLVEIVTAMIEQLPKLTGFCIITNAIRSKRVIEAAQEVAAVARRHRQAFSVVVSVDGVGASHDANRGVVGNFDSVVQVIETLKANGIPVSIGCTLTPVNAYDADDVLLWCEENGISQWEFRIGVDIARVYNIGYAERQPFSAAQLFHLVQFFQKLACHPAVDHERRRFYRSLVGQLSTGAPRRAGCDWKTRGVTLDSRGELSYCSVQSPILGSAIEQSAFKIYTSSRSVRDTIVREHCQNCKHDLQGPPPAEDLFAEALGNIVSPIRSRMENAAKRFRKVNLSPVIQTPQKTHPSQWTRVLVTGWYGTETAGDKAILAEVLEFLRIHAPSASVTLTTLNEIVSRQTREELQAPNWREIIPIETAASPEVIGRFDAVVLGGGPLEEIAAMEYFLRLFEEANRLRKARVIFGCGVGTFFTDGTRDIAAGIVRLATSGFFRDPESHTAAASLGGNPELAVGCDPAVAFLSRWRAANRMVETHGNVLAGMLRANTTEYISGAASQTLEVANQSSARQFANIFAMAAEPLDAGINLLPMHTLAVGGDDRMFAREVARNCPRKVTVRKGYYSLHDTLALLDGATAAVAMRYHGHLFAAALGVPFVSIDYTGKNGKVSSLVNRIGLAESSEDWSSLDPHRAARRLIHVATERQFWSNHLAVKTEELLSSLYGAYEDTFGVEVQGAPRLQACSQL
jgi:MoaA/NifB/PqqE/SkfB family radical SAM enzyme/polysaccharide pyruvyl transferase WcaK-like protein